MAATGVQVQQQEPLTRARSAGKKIMLFTNGSRGDVQPFVALAAALQSAGLVVRVVTNVNHVGFMQSFGLDAVGINADCERLIREDPEVRKYLATGSILKLMQVSQEEDKRNFPQILARKIEAVDAWKPDVIITTPLDLWEARAIADASGTPLMQAALQFVCPSKDQLTVFGEPNWFPHRILGTLLTYIGFRSGFDSRAAEIFKQLPQVEPSFCTDFRQMMLEVMHPIAPILVGFSPSLYSPKSDWTDDAKEWTKITGFWVVPQKEQEAKLARGDTNFGGSAATALKAFLAAGPAVYMGWGSMIAVSEKHMACLAVRALMKAGLRGIVLGGWARLRPELLQGEPDAEAMRAYAEEHMLFVESAPHEWLFPQCQAIVHHGGAGTTAAALRSGVPTVITPVAFDQFDNSLLAANNGAGIALRQFSKVTVGDLASAVTKCATDEAMIRRAQDLGKKLKAETGLSNAVHVVDAWVADEVDTGKWQARYEQRIREIKQLKSQNSPGFCSWFFRLCCSQRPNDYSVELCDELVVGDEETQPTLPTLLRASERSAGCDKRGPA